MRWGVRIRIGGKGAIFLWRFIKTYAFVNLGITLRQLLNYFWLGAIIRRRSKSLLRREEELGNHVPVN